MDCLGATKPRSDSLFTWGDLILSAGRSEHSSEREKIKYFNISQPEARENLASPGEARLLLSFLGEFCVVLPGTERYETKARSGQIS